MKGPVGILSIDDENATTKTTGPRFFKLPGMIQLLSGVRLLLISADETIQFSGVTFLACKGRIVALREPVGDCGLAVVRLWSLVMICVSCFSACLLSA